MTEKLTDRRSVIEIFDEVAENYRDKTAIVFNQESLTYGGLKKKSEEVALFLADHGVADEEIVSFVADRTIDSIVNMFGILRAGAAYLPIDRQLPAERIKYMMSISKSKMILCNNAEDGEIFGHMDGVKLIIPEHGRENTGGLKVRRKGNERLAYVMFTSGSEGTPKGVMIEDRGIVRLVKDTKYFPFSDELVFLQSGTLCFDASTFDVFGALLNGAVLHISDKDTLLDSELLGCKIRQSGINSMFLTTPLFHQLAGTDIDIFEPLNNLIVGGDVLFTEDAVRIKKHFPNIRLFNGYGPTENTTFSTVYEVKGDETDDIPIGKCIDYSTVYVLNEDMKQVAEGEKGELYVGGEGVARGYIGDDQRTAERFIRDIKGHGVMYRTGDMVMKVPDGNLMFLGRCDSQIKYRGFRIELAGIQKNIMSDSGVKDCFVMCEKIHTDKQLIAFVELENSYSENADKYITGLRKALGEKLPGYMIPEKIISIKKLPLNLNGKVDKSELISILRDKSGKVTNDTGTDFWNILEKNLEGQVKDSDILYEVGLNSISAIHILSELKQAGYHVSMRKMLSVKTVKELRELVCENE